MDQITLQSILREHELWLNDRNEGKQANLADVDLSFSHLAGANLAEVNLKGANLEFADLSKADLSRANLAGANLKGSNLEGANLAGATLQGAKLEFADLSGADLSEADLERAHLAGANLHGADFGDVSFGDVDLEGVDLQGAYLSGANLEEANLKGANLGGANLTFADLSRADLSGANLVGANLEHAYLWGANLMGANLDGANLARANFGDVDLKGANLKERDLSGADLEGANLAGTDLEGANLGEANLKGANLAGSNLTGANLEYADLEDANLAGTNFGDVDRDEHLVFLKRLKDERKAHLDLQRTQQKQGFNEEREQGKNRPLGSAPSAPRGDYDDDDDDDDEAGCEGVVPEVYEIKGSPTYVDATAFCPKCFKAGETELVQIIVHPKDQRKKALKYAREADRQSAFAAPSKSLGGLMSNDQITVQLDVRGAKVDDPPISMLWLGEPLIFAFRVTSDGQSKQVSVNAVLKVNDIFVGRITFNRKVGFSYSMRDVLSLFVTPKLSRFKRVFFSYSSKDRIKVKEYAEQYEKFGISFFQDILDLEPGERWKKGLWKEIDKCDLFILFWSNDSKQSEWVIKEAERAWRRQARNGGIRPIIQPELLENPPPTPDQDWLREFHFNDPRFHW